MIEKADLLANKIKEELADLNVRVTRPVRTGELRISGLNDSVTGPDVALVIGKEGGTFWIDVKTGKIRLTRKKQP